MHAYTHTCTYTYTHMHTHTRTHSTVATDIPARIRRRRRKATSGADHVTTHAGAHASGRGMIMIEGTVVCDAGGDGNEDHDDDHESDDDHNDDDDGWLSKLMLAEMHIMGDSYKDRDLDPQVTRALRRVPTNKRVCAQAYAQSHTHTCAQT